MPCCLDLLCLVKNATFIGIIGNTQGVNKAANPPTKPAKKIAHQELLLFSDSDVFNVFCVTVVFTVSI